MVTGSWARLAANSRAQPTRLIASRIIGLAAIASYNWWVAVLFDGTLLRSPDEFFSDLEVSGGHAALVLRRLDLLAGVLTVLALLVRGRRGPEGDRREWGWLIVFGVAGALGGLFPYECADGISAACRSAELHLQLPLHHYLHMGAGIIEFGTATVAALYARRRVSNRADLSARLVRLTSTVIVASYPVLGAAYLSDRFGAVVEPIYFVAFSVIVGVELFEPARRPARWPAGGSADDGPRPIAGAVS